MTFNDLEKLKKYLREDRERATLNPVRFINVDSLHMWIEVKKFLLTLADETMLLSSFCEEVDTTPNVKRISSELKKVSYSVCVFPLSEYLRVHPDIATSVISRMVSIEFVNNDNGKLRVYFLMYRMKSVIENLPKSDPRKKDCYIYLKTAEEQDYQLTIIQSNLKIVVPGNDITGFKNYLQYWEQNPDKPLVLHTQNATHFERERFFDNVRVIVTPFDLCTDQIRDFPGSFEERFGSFDEWYELAHKAINAGGFINACFEEMSINHFSLQLFDNWSRYSGFKRWLLWLWTKAQPKNGYIHICATESSSVEDFINRLYCTILQQTLSSDYEKVYIERKAILKSAQVVPTTEFWQKVSQLSGINALICLTDLTDAERRKIFSLLAGTAFEERDKYVEALRLVYPQVSYYLNCSNTPLLPNNHSQYFDEYKWLKITDTITESFLGKVKLIAEGKGETVFSLEPRNQIVANKYDDNTIILFVDGLGIEYADYLTYLFSDLDQSVFNFSIDVGYCNLPSTTENNKDFFTNRQIIDPPMRELDEHKHANCVYPENIIRELNILDTIKDKTLGVLSGSISRIIIAADHGTSRLAVKIRNTSFDRPIAKPENAKICKYGRYCEETMDGEVYPTAIKHDGWIIFADYSRFTQSGAPIDEIHGGASLEEWLVPIITIEKTTGVDKREAVKINLLTTSTRPEIGTNLITVHFEMSGKIRNNVIARIKGNKVQCVYDGNKYTFQYLLSETELKLAVQIIDGVILGTFEVDIIQSIKQNDKFDI